MLTAGNDDREHEHRADDGKRDEHDVVLSGLLRSDIGVDLRAHCIACHAVRVEEGLAAQQKAPLRSRTGDGALDCQRRSRPLAQPALLSDSHRQNAAHEIRPRGEVDRAAVAGQDRGLPRVVSGQVKLIPTVEVSAKPGLLIEHPRLDRVHGVAPDDEAADRRLEVPEHGREASTHDHQRCDDQQRDHDEHSCEPLREAAIGPCR